MICLGEIWHHMLEEIGKLTPTHLLGWSVKKDDFCADLKFHSIPNKKGFRKLTSPTPQGLGVCKPDFSVQIWTFHAFHRKRIILVLDPTPMGGGSRSSYKKNFARSCMKCLDLHSRVMFAMGKSWNHDLLCRSEHFM